MEYKEIINLLGGIVDPEKLPKYTTIKWIEFYNESNGKYNPNKDARFKTPELTNKHILS